MRMAVRIVLALGLVVALFNLFVAEMARREYVTPPRPDEEWIVTEQVMVPPGDQVASRSVIMVHGFGSSPLGFKPLARPLAERGFRVVMPVTPGQGRDVHASRREEISPEILLRWLRGIIQEETRRANGLKPHLVGFSMGGTLATVVAVEDLVDRVVLLAPFYAHASADSLIHVGCKVVEPFVPVLPKPWRGSIADPTLYAEYFPGTWYVSLGAVRRLQELADIARAAAPSLARPTLLLGSSNDFVASFAVSRGMFSGNRNVTIHEFPRSDHILLYDFDRGEVVRMVVEFLSAE